MKALVLLLSALVVVPVWAKEKAVQPCIVNYSIVVHDTLGNVNQGISDKKNLKWLTQDMEKKYPGVCYAAPDQSVKVVLYITITPDTYNGVRFVPNTSTETGRVNGSDGYSATYEGSTTSSQAIPYHFQYGHYLLTVETLEANDKVIAHHRFEQDGIYHKLYGIPLGGRGHHPEKALVEDALKWISTGGLNDPLQSAE